MQPFLRCCSCRKAAETAVIWHNFMVLSIVMKKNSPRESRSRYNNTQHFLLNLLSLLTMIPLAPYINRFLPPVEIGAWNLDLILSLIISFLFTRLLLWIFKPLIIPAFVLICGVLLFNLFTRHYSFDNVYQDYKGMVLHNWVTREEKQQDLLSFSPQKVESSRSKLVNGIREKIQYKDSIVRNFSVKHSLDYFDEYLPKYGLQVRLLSLFKYINENFKYVSDAKRDEYFATPRETILNGLGGDCDDHSLLMASCLKSIGGVTRIVIIKGHAYPELFCGDKEGFEQMKSAIVHLFTNPPVEALYYHENDGQYWINLDYSAHHPGGPYLNDDVVAVIDL